LHNCVCSAKEHIMYHTALFSQGHGTQCLLQTPGASEWQIQANQNYICSPLSSSSLLGGAMLESSWGWGAYPVALAATTIGSFFLFLHISTLWFVRWQFVQYIPGFATIWFLTATTPIPKICDTNNEFYASDTEMPSSHMRVDSLCYCRVSHFIPAVAISR
jgi:hypothetical protein